MIQWEKLIFISEYYENHCENHRIEFETLGNEDLVFVDDKIRCLILFPSKIDFTLIQKEEEQQK